MNQGKVAYYRDENVRFDVYFIAKKLRLFRKELKILLADRP